jgi:hypothetical protein
MLGGAPVALRLEHPRQQFLRRLPGFEVGQVGVLARQHEPRLELQQRRDQHEELRRHLQVELATRLEVVEVRDDDLGELDLEQVDLLAQDERQQQIERPGEDLQVQLERGNGHDPQANDVRGRQPPAAA